MRGLLQAGLLLAPIASAFAIRTPEPELVAETLDDNVEQWPKFFAPIPSTIIDIEVAGLAGSPDAISNLVFQVDILKSSKLCGEASVKVNGEILEQTAHDDQKFTGHRTITIDGHDVAASWEFECSNPEQEFFNMQALRFTIDAVDEIKMMDGMTGFSVLFHPDSEKPIFANAVDNPKLQLPRPFEEVEPTLEDELIQLEFLKHQMRELKWQIRETKQSIQAMSEDIDMDIAECDSIKCFAKAVIGKAHKAISHLKPGHPIKKPKWGHGPPKFGHGNHTKHNCSKPHFPKHGNHSFPHPPPWRRPHRLPICHFPPPPHHGPPHHGPPHHGPPHHGPPHHGPPPPHHGPPPPHHGPPPPHHGPPFKGPGKKPGKPGKPGKPDHHEEHDFPGKPGRPDHHEEHDFPGKPGRPDHHEEHEFPGRPEGLESLEKPDFEWADMDRPDMEEGPDMSDHHDLPGKPKSPFPGHPGPDGPLHKGPPPPGDGPHGEHPPPPPPKGHGPHHGPPRPHGPVSLVFHVAKYVVLGVLLSALLRVLHKRCCSSSRRAAKQARREERLRRRAYRHAARKQAWRSWAARWCSYVPGVNHEEATDYEEKRAMLAEEEGSDVGSEIRNLRTAVDVVSDMVSAEEGRANLGRASMETTATLPRYGESNEYLPSYDDMETEDSELVADGFRGTPRGAVYTPSTSDTDSSSIRSVISDVKQ